VSIFRINKSFVTFVMFFATSGAMYAQQTLALQSPEYEIAISNSGHHILTAEGYYSYAVPGYPDLPSRIIYVAVPPNVDINSIEVLLSHSQVTDLGR
jgi:hypothetical protein